MTYDGYWKREESETAFDGDGTLKAEQKTLVARWSNDGELEPQAGTIIYHSQAMPEAFRGATYKGDVGELPRYMDWPKQQKKPTGLEWHEVAESKISRVCCNLTTAIGPALGEKIKSKQQSTPGKATFEQTEWEELKIGKAPRLGDLKYDDYVQVQLEEGKEAYFQPTPQVAWAIAPDGYGCMTLRGGAKIGDEEQNKMAACARTLRT